MRDEHSTAVAERIFALIEADFESDAAFERAACLPDKTVNNWRRGRSSSYMKRLPMLSELFHVSMSELLGLTDGEVTADLSEEDSRVLTLRFGLEGGRPLSPEETGKMLNLTPEEVVAREANALAQLRNG